jgi:ABC-type glycerol-3-phosphate transport system permease component
MKKVAFFGTVGIVCVIAFFPFYWLINTSLLREVDLFSYPPIFFPRRNPFVAYYNYFVNSHILLWLKNTILVSSISTVISTVLAIFAAYSISRFRYRGRTFLTFVILITQMLPPVLLIIPIYVIFLSFKLNNTLMGLTIIFTILTVPIGTWFLKGFFDTLPKELEESATIDGASQLGTLLRITLPLSVSGIVATATWSFIIAWDEYLFASTIINTQQKWMLSVGLSSYLGQYSVSWSDIMTGAVVATIPLGFLFMFFQRYLLSGLTAGSIKG